MPMKSVNCYHDADRASAYATLEFANTYHLAFRDLPKVLSRHVTGTRRLDFGCGTGRSTRFLRKLGFQVTGVDISQDMLRIARATDPSGDYRVVPDDNFNQFCRWVLRSCLLRFHLRQHSGRNEGKNFERPRKAAGSLWDHRQPGFLPPHSHPRVGFVHHQGFFRKLSGAQR